MTPLVAAAIRRSGATHRPLLAGAPGNDGVSVGAFSFFTRWKLAWIGRQLRVGSYRPRSLRKVIIPKSKGGTRALQIPSVRDRVVATGLHLLLYPLYEKVFFDRSHGYRPARGVPTAMRMIRRHVQQGRIWVLDADIRSCFPSLSHRIILGLLERGSPWVSTGSPPRISPTP